MYKRQKGSGHRYGCIKESDAHTRKGVITSESVWSPCIRVLIKYRDPGKGDHWNIDIKWSDILQKDH